MYKSQQFIANQGRTHLEEIFRNAGQSGDTTFQQDVKASQDYYQNNDSLKMYIQDVSTQL
jgi:hypothetical protein